MNHRLEGEALMKLLRVIAAALAVVMVAGGPAVAQELRGDAQDEAEDTLKELFMNQRFVAKVVFPAWKDGIDLTIDGTWDQGDVTRDIKDHGVGIGIDEPAIVTDLKLKNEHIEIHLNGGGRGTFGDQLLDTGSSARAGDRQTGGSRINLRFDRRIRAEDIDPAKLAEWLSPVVDAAALQRAAALEDIPEEFREAAERGEIVEGMSKQTVFAVLGEPAERSVDLETTPPTEKWQYNLEGMEILVVTIQDGVVTRIDRF